MMTIGQRIKERRIALGLSADDVAQRLGKNRATVYRYESDDIKDLPISILEPLARILCTTPADLLGWSPDPTPTASDLALLAAYHAATPALQLAVRTILNV